MSDNTNERLEREALEAIVAADLSAKMKHWRNQAPPPPGKGGSPRLRILVLLLALGAAVWWFWPTRKYENPPQPQPAPQQPATLPKQQIPEMPVQQAPEPVAQKQTETRYLAIAQSNYRKPDFISELRGEADAGQDALDIARRALAGNHPSEALEALKQVSTEYQTDADYLRAHALFQLKKYPQAASLFGRMRGSIRYGEAAQWYEILALLPDFNQNKTLIMSRLNKISGDEGHAFQQDAKRLAEAL